MCPTLSKYRIDMIRGAMLIAERRRKRLRAGTRKVKTGLMTSEVVCVVSLINSLTTLTRQMIACAGRPFRSVRGNSLRRKKRSRSKQSLKISYLIHLKSSKFIIGDSHLFHCLL